METSLSNIVLPPGTGKLHDFSGQEFPAIVSSWRDGELVLESRGTHFGFVAAGSAQLQWNRTAYPLAEGMYFSVPHSAIVRGEGIGFVVTRLDFDGFFHLGGPIENRGRLRYIDGCTDSLLIPPVVLGDPCLNLLHVPPSTDQTPHTHPSLRVGMIVRGRGICRTEAGPVDLLPGLIFHLPADFRHSFHTQDDSLLLVAWHPDSDFGPTHETHPMLNRTLVDGRPINQETTGSSEKEPA